MAKTTEAGGLCRKCSVDGAWEEVQLPSYYASPLIPPPYSHPSSLLGQEPRTHRSQWEVPFPQIADGPVSGENKQGKQQASMNWELQLVVEFGTRKDRTVESLALLYPCKERSLLPLANMRR